MKPPRVEAKIVDDNSMDTMDLYRLFEKQDAAEDTNHVQANEASVDKIDREKMVSDEGYFNTIQEESDVKSFLGECRLYLLKKRSNNFSYNFRN